MSPLYLRAANNPQPAILAAAGASNRAVVFSNGNDLPTPAQNLVAGFPSDAQPQGVSYFGRDSALISDFLRSRIYVVQISTAALVSTIDTSTAGYDGTGTIAVAPNLSAALAMGNSNQLYVIRGPFNPSSTITALTLPGTLPAFQTQAIVFDNSGRAFVNTTTGISVLDAPYDTVAFTIPVGNSQGGAIAISPDGQTLLTTNFTNVVRIFRAPFSATSTPESLTLPPGVLLDGIACTPDGTTAIVVNETANTGTYCFAISAPFGINSTVETIPVPAQTEGFEDVGISADSQVAILTGGTAVSNNVPIFIRAPFTAAGAQSFAVPVENVSNPSRGAGSVRFLPPGSLLG